MMFTRRSILRMMGLSAGAALAPRAAWACEDRAGTASTLKNLVVVFCTGGLRSMDAFDHYPSAEADGLSVSSEFLQADCTEVDADEDWYLPPPAANLSSYASRMAIVRHVGMETASHAAGKVIATTGKNRSDAPAGPVIVAHHQDADRAVVPIGSMSFNWGLQSGSYEGALSGEPAMLQELLSATAFTGNSAVESAIWTQLQAADARVADASRKRSKLRDWQAQASYAKSIQDAEVAQCLAVTDGTTEEERFEAAFLALKYRLTSVVTVSVDGFDTHTTSQTAKAGALCDALATLCGRLDGAGILDTTTIVVVSDFDRTPSINGSGGSDHWLYGSMAVLGGGVQHGVFGGLDKGAYPGAPGRSVQRQDIWASVLKYFGVAHETYFPTSTPIEGLFDYPEGSGS